MKRYIPRVFLCHSTQDKPIVRRIAATLESKGCIVWIDEAELKIGDSLVEQIAIAIDRVDFVVAIISPHSAKSQWVRKELSLAMTKEILGKRIAVLPVLVGQTQLPLTLRDKLYADFRKPKFFDYGMERLYDSIISARIAPDRKPKRPLAKRKSDMSLRKVANRGRPSIHIAGNVADLVADSSKKHVAQWLLILRAQGLVAAFIGGIVLVVGLAMATRGETQGISFGMVLVGCILLLGAISGLIGHTAMSLAVSDDPNLTVSIEDTPNRHGILKLHRVGKHNRKFILGWWLFYVGFFSLATIAAVILLLVVAVVIKYGISWH